MFNYIALLFLKIGRHITGHWWDSSQIFLPLFLVLFFALWSEVINSRTSLLLIVFRVYITGWECFITITLEGVLLLRTGFWNAAGGVFQLQWLSSASLFGKTVAEVCYVPQVTKNLKVTRPISKLARVRLTQQICITIRVITSPFFWSCSSARSRVSEETAKISFPRTPSPS